MSDEQFPPAPEPAPYPPAPEPPPPVPPSQRFPSWKQALVMLLGGLALAISACFGCLFTVMSGGGRTNASLEGLALLLALLAGAGALAAIVGVVLVLMRILRGLFAKKDETPS
jgi:hypothetical protein